MTSQEVLKQYFGYDSFRKGQEALISHLLAGEDVLGIMPTGAGKSLCYQIPALLLPGMTIVISPLISLMQDQVNALRANGIAAAFLNSAMDENDRRDTLLRVYRGDIKILYAAPERLETQSFFTIAQEVDISMVAVDEAHCVSQWGQDFRPSYLKILQFLEQLPKRPIIGAFTATATREVAADIIRILQLREPFTMTTGFDRENLYFGVDQPRDKFRALVEFIRTHEGESGIVYCISRRLVEQVTADLCDAGISAVRYHAGLTDEERRENQDSFIYDRAQVMVATNAFGMGIDKSNVSFVVHYNMPKNLESYYQEAGRAGRDGSKAECILFYSGSDVQTNLFMIRKDNENDQLGEAERERIRKQDEERLWRMQQYCTGQSCLRHFLLRYFGERSPDTCGNCSFCRGNYEKRDVSVEALKIVSCMYWLHKRELHFGTKMIIDILRGNETERLEKFRFPDTLSTFGIMQDVPEHICRDIIRFLLAEEWISQGGEYQVLMLNRRSAELLKNRPVLTMNVVKKTEPRQAQRSVRSSVPDDLDEALYMLLKETRKQLSAKESVPTYIIFTDKTLQDMCRKKPTSDMAFLSVEGVGQVKLEKYGSRFMTVIREYLKDKRQ